MKRFSIDAPILVTSALALTMPDTIASRLSIDVDVLGQSNASVFTLPSPTSNNSYFVDEPVEEVKVWKAEYTQRFQKLSRKEARCDITLAEVAELDELTKLRRAKKYPRTANEIIWQRKQQALTNSLLESLKKYVDFHEAASAA